jgi:hypothetical protein
MSRTNPSCTQTLRWPGFFLLAGLVLSFVPSILLHAQVEDETYFLGQFRGYEIPASTEESEILDEAENEHRLETSLLKSELEKIQKQLLILEQDTATKVEKLLTARQLQSINEQKLEDTRKRVADDAPFLLSFVKFSAQVAKTEKFIIYEGLPHAKQEKLDQIKSTEKTTNFEGFDFYAEPLPGKAMTSEELREILADHQLFSPTPPGGKFCGGFHPDICLQYEVDGKDFRTHICFGCYEILAVGPEQKYSFDYNGEARNKLLKIAKSIVVKNDFKSY